MTSAKNGPHFCSCHHGCRSREEMRKRHGTPDKHAINVYAAVPSFISVTEANAGIARYRAEYDAAPESAEVKP